MRFYVRRQAVFEPSYKNKKYHEIVARVPLCHRSVNPHPWEIHDYGFSSFCISLLSAPTVLFFSRHSAI